MNRHRETVRLWDVGSGLPLDQLTGFLEQTFSPALKCAPPARLFSSERTARVARLFQSFRITDPWRLGSRARRSSAGDRERIRGILEGTAPSGDRGAFMFDGLRFLGLAASAMGRGAFRPGTINIIFTSAVPCTWDANEVRYHARSLLCGFPSLVSTSGAVEGPARPRGYYVAKMMGLSDAEARRKYLGRFLEHGDHRMPAVAKGLAAQAVFYHLTGNPFCELEDCRLFNARWQEQLVASQVKDPRFCESHGRFMNGLKRNKSRN